MDNKKLRRMKRRDLLEILLLQRSRIDELEDGLNRANELLSERGTIISESDRIEEASLKINSMFDTLKKGIDNYLECVQKYNNDK